MICTEPQPHHPIDDTRDWRELVSTFMCSVAATYDQGEYVLLKHNVSQKERIQMTIVNRGNLP